MRTLSALIFTSTIALSGHAWADVVDPGAACACEHTDSPDDEAPLALAAGLALVAFVASRRIVR